MKPAKPSRIVLFCLIAAFCGCGASAPLTTAPTTTPTTTAAIYEQRRPSYDGIGKVYMGREIAQVMGHQGADWLERPDREVEERTDLLVELMGLKPADVVADIGAGTGYFSFRLAGKVPQGKVLAVDIQPEMLELVTANAKKRGVSNVEPVLGSVTDPKLPAGAVDVVLMFDAYN